MFKNMNIKKQKMKIAYLFGAFAFLMASTHVCTVSAQSAEELLKEHFTSKERSRGPQAQEIAKNDLEATVVSDTQAVEINKTLKNVIEENQQLASRNERLREEINQLKEDITVEQTAGTDQVSGEVELLARQEMDSPRDAELVVMDSVDEHEDMDDSYSSDEYFEMASAQDDPEWNLEKEMALEATSAQDVKAQEAKTLDLLSRIDAFAEEDDQLRKDAAKAHYNMGNIYYQKGEYEIAAREYYQAVTLMPDDPDAHYNLAYVSGENLSDHKTALKHYKLYLYLHPNAIDKHIVREKILHAELAIRNTVDSPLEKTSSK